MNADEIPVSRYPGRPFPPNIVCPCLSAELPGLTHLPYLATKGLRKVIGLCPRYLSFLESRYTCTIGSTVPSFPRPLWRGRSAHLD
jgi:hypothetical protein